MASCEGFPVLDGAVLPDVLSPDVGVGREEGREDGGLGTLVDGQRTLVLFLRYFEVSSWYTVFHPLVVDVACVLFLDHPRPQETRKSHAAHLLFGYISGRIPS